MAKCDFCPDPKGLLLDYNGKFICEVCYFNYLAFGDSRAGLCFECKEIKPFLPRRPDLNNKKICESCYDKILNSELNK